MLKVYGLKAPHPQLKGIIRDVRITWLLEELNLPYELIQLDPTKGENKTPEYLKINPTGKVPTLQDGDFALFESGAICEYLAEKHHNFIPEHGTPDYYICKQWCYFATTNIDPQAGRIFGADFMMEQNEKTQHIRNLATEILPRFLTALEQHLQNRQFLMGDTFTIADILTISGLQYIRHTNLLDSYPKLKLYRDRMMQRPAFVKATNNNG